VRRRKLLLWLLAGLAAALPLLVSVWPPRPRISRANYRRIRNGMRLAEVVALFGEQPVASWTPPDRPVRISESFWNADGTYVGVVTDDSGRVVGKGSGWDREPALLRPLPDGFARKWWEWFPSQAPPQVTIIPPP
jgi:hypothetical protein